MKWTYVNKDLPKDSKVKYLAIHKESINLEWIIRGYYQPMDGKWYTEDTDEEIGEIGDGDESVYAWMDLKEPTLPKFKG